MRFPRRLRAAICSILIPSAGIAAAEPLPFRQWGGEALDAVDRDLRLPESGLFAEKADFAAGTKDHPAFMWGVGVQLSAMAAAAALEPDRYLKPLREYSEAIQVYWLKHDGIEGFDVQPGPKASDRYYDDNAWLVLALTEVFEVTKDRKHLDRAGATFRFVMSGEDDKLGGGLYWREVEKKSKNTCTNAPAIVSALRLHQLTKEPAHLETAKRLHAWTCKNLQDSDGLFWDNIRLDGRVDRRKFSYNSALMIRANCLFHAVTGEASYLAEARRIATAAEKQWVRESGAVSDSGRFAHLLLESLLELHRRDRDPRWHDVVRRCLVHLHGEMKDGQGRYPHRWDRKRPGPLRELMLLDQASPARIYWLAAREIPRP
jgi:uncharacterized protein YyaL (SSP411 family)